MNFNNFINFDKHYKIRFIRFFEKMIYKSINLIINRVIFELKYEIY